MSDGLQELIGKTIKEVYLDKSLEETIIFATEDKHYAFTLYGDCCSHSYIHSLEGVENLLGQEVRNITTTDLEDEKEDPEWDDCTRVHVENITTVKGVCKFTWKNRSNGYYDGYIELSTSNPKELVSVENDINVETIKKERLNEEKKET